jgi:hypothetical protein
VKFHRLQENRISVNFNRRLNHIGKNSIVLDYVSNLLNESNKIEEIIRRHRNVKNQNTK